MPKNEANEEKDVKVAKITAIQAIIVALITATAGVGAGYLASSNNDRKSSSKTHWVYIKEIRAGYLAPSLEEAKIRLIFDVNGIAFSFPAKTLWASTGPHTGAFPLPNAEEYNISFSALIQLNSESTPITASSQEIKNVTASSLPLDDEVYHLTFSKEHVYSVREEVEVVFSIR